MRELERWVEALAEALGVDPDAVDVDGVLDLAKDAAHQVVRPAAPVSTFLAGWAAATAVAAGEDPELAVEEALDKASTLALDWSSDLDDDDDDDSDRDSDSDADGDVAAGVDGADDTGGDTGDTPGVPDGVLPDDLATADLDDDLADDDLDGGAR
ncbi:hypothetical protein CLV28_2297 [Sediminihabitans luteus]|uniref:DUF6457 domain-containing protein n=1 Tax=Sediminihabitans luteus TaxID=1138585 RepID=A0A2M9CEV0_9CELL|nr:DUF6457 domain-containing protein [Sediminihabitans luteus]PJJ70461.1 hypothetical protein CLV28_2297 [Sediminihabitans luteus]GII97934.1 hypothetical protein Slu03_03120 [Sediminihabitans luteus]